MDKKRREISFNPGDFAYLKVSPIRGTRRFQVHGKLALRYIGPYQVLKKVGKVAYRLQLPEGMSDIHPVFHVSQLRRCLRVPEAEHVPEETIDLQPDLRYQEVRICKVQWTRHGVEEATWERQDALKKEFPHLFRNQPNLEDEIHFKWGRFVTYRKFAKLNRALKPFFSSLSSISP